jgi:hypothetical protein
MDTSIEHGGDRLRQRRRQPRRAMADADKTREQHAREPLRSSISSPTPTARAWIARAWKAGMASRRKTRIDGGAEPGGQTVDALPAFERTQHNRARSQQAQAKGFVQGDRCKFARDSDDRLDPACDLTQHDRRGRSRSRIMHWRRNDAQFTSPLAFRKGGATVRGSFLSTSTWRLSSCIVGLSSAAPTFSSTATIFSLAAISGRTTGARK